MLFFFFQAEDGIRDTSVTGVQTCALPISVETEFDVRNQQSLPRVDIVLSYVGADGAMIEAAAKAGAKGIVSAATGAGRRSEERRVGKEVRAQRARCRGKKHRLEKGGIGTD